MPNEIDNTQNEAEQKSDPLSSDVSSLTRQLSSDSLDQALESALSGSDKNKLSNEKVVVREESPNIEMAEPPPLPENSDDDNQDDELDFFDSEDKKEWVWKSIGLPQSENFPAQGRVEEFQFQSGKFRFKKKWKK